MRAQPSTSEAAETIAALWPSQPDWWMHAMTDWVAANEGAYRVCGAIAAECQTLAGRRLEKNLHLLPELASAKAPVEVWNARYQFWQTAAENYGAECFTLAKLAASSIPTASLRAAAGSLGPTSVMPSKAA